VNRAIQFAAGIGYLVVLVQAMRDVAAGMLVPSVVVASFFAYVLSAEVMLGRARASRGPRTQVAAGVAQWAPLFGWVPYAVVAFRLGPELKLPDPATAVGVGLTAGGIALALWALVTIGRHFDLELEVHRDHEVVRHGPYGLVRHPIYAGLLLHTIGACLATGNALFAAGSLVVTLPLLVLRARTEERMLRRELGSAYDAYAREVGMLIPFVGRT